MSSFSSFPYLDLSFAHSPNICLVFLFPVAETKGQQYLWEFVFLFHCLKKAGFSAEKQGGDITGSVNSCVMSETVKHAGEGGEQGLMYEMICV